MQFQLSVFYSNSFLSYLITSEDKTSFHFQLKSAPPAASNVPDDFTVKRAAPDKWEFDKEFDKDFEHSVIKTLKRTKLW